MALFRKDQNTASIVGGLETVLGGTTNMQGVLKSDGNIRVDGILQGRIETAGNLVIGPTARIVADIRANAVQVWGQVQGNIQTAGRLEILSSGRVFGEVTVGSLMIDEGGLFRGQCFMDGQDVDELLISDDSRLLTAGTNSGPVVDSAEAAVGIEALPRAAIAANGPDREPMATEGPMPAENDG
jgi:cytoskeletal protein CcmA (bactofilin family)